MLETEKKQDYIEITRYHPSYDEAITSLCLQFSEESLDEYGLGVSQEQLDKMTAICKDTSFFLLCNGEPVGLIAGVFLNNLTNGKLALQECVWFVQKEYRYNGMKLLKSFEELARERGASQIVMALMCNSKAEKLGNLYVRLGYKPFEVQYLKEL